LSNPKLFQKYFLSQSKEKANCILCTLQEIKKKRKKKKKEKKKKKKEKNEKITRKTQGHDHLFLIQVGP